MVSTSNYTNRDLALAELVEYSAQALLKKEAGRSPERPQLESGLVTESTAPQTTAPGTHLIETTIEVSFQASQLHSYAAPLAPMRERDLRALAELFVQEAIAEIEADILHNLLQRIPEPCWEDVFVS